jgi:hypothetical protein
MNKTRVKLAVATLAAFLIVIQIFQPQRSNPAVMPGRSLHTIVRMPESVQGSLRRACGDCHSNETAWPWYSHVAPLSWVITDDVNEGRRHMNFDDWQAGEAPGHPNERISGICKEIRQNGMPPFSYRVLHQSARLKPGEIAAICDWSHSPASGAASF